MLEALMYMSTKNHQNIIWT